MTCKDCVHYEVCKDDCDSGYSYEDENGNYFTDDCNGFKNKADFVEVVRCAECKSYNTDNCSDGFGWCENLNMVVVYEHFCSYGERKDA